MIRHLSPNFTTAYSAVCKNLWLCYYFIMDGRFEHVTSKTTKAGKGPYNKETIYITFCICTVGVCFFPGNSKQSKISLMKTTIHNLLQRAGRRTLRRTSLYSGLHKCLTPTEPVDVSLGLSCLSSGLPGLFTPTACLYFSEKVAKF